MSTAVSNDIAKAIELLKAGRVVYDGPSSGLARDQLIDIYGPEIEEVFWEGDPK